MTLIEDGVEPIKNKPDSFRRYRTTIVIEGKFPFPTYNFEDDDIFNHFRELSWYFEEWLNNEGTEDQEVAIVSWDSEKI